MTENRSKSGNGREGSPLWANIGSSSSLTFNPGQLQPLLLPFNTPTQSNVPPVDAGEVDHFIGQNSPPSMTPVSHSDSSTTLFAASASPNDSFEVGYAAAPPTFQSADTADSSFHTANTSLNQQVYAQPLQDLFPGSAPPPTAQAYQPSDTMQPDLAPVSTGYTNDQYENARQSQYMPTVSAVGAVPMFNPTQPVSAESQAIVPHGVTVHYSPVVPHWFYCMKVADKPVWKAFTYKDSMTLEESFLNGEPDVVQTDGGRYDVSISQRERRAVYWAEETCEIRRSSWFHRDDFSMTYIPYSEEVAEELEETYCQTMADLSWHKKVHLRSTQDIFVFHSAGVFVQYSSGSFPFELGAPLSEMSRPKVVKRGTDDMESIANGECGQIDELVFVVHGIGPVCDLKLRGIVPCVDDMRNTGMTMLNSHFQTAKCSNKIGRVEFLPIYWYDALRNEAIGVDRRLGNITLPSVSKIRELTNEVLLDILFYNSPLYSQSILDKVGGELNRLYQLFIDRNPGWNGQVSLAGHSLGSLVLFDLLSMQGVTQSSKSSSNPNNTSFRESTPVSEIMTERSRSATPCSTPVDGKLVAIETMETVLEHLALTNLSAKFHEEQIDLESLLMCSEDDLKSIGLPLGPRKKILKFVTDREKKLTEKLNAEQEPVVDVTSSADRVDTQSDLSCQPSWLTETTSSTQVGYVSGMQGVGFPLVNYPQLIFHISKFFALGSPIAMFLTIRGVENLSRDFHLPTCQSVFNIFHPFDPVAYRLEPLINPDIKQKPVLMPHHKGRKRLHLELKENIVKVGADIKHRVMKSLKSTWASINDFARAHTGVANQGADTEQELSDQVDKAIQSAVNEEKADTSQSELESVSSVAEGEVEVGQLNQGRRIDYVLQEAPFESFNDYLFALSSHLVYWESEDVSLMLMKEIYAPMGVLPDVKDKTKQHKNSLAEVAARLNTTPSIPSVGVSYPSQPPLAGVSYPSQPPLAGVSYPSQPPLAGVSYPSQPPLAGVSYPSQPPLAGVSYSSQPPLAGASYSSQPATAGISYPSQPPLAGVSYPSRPPLAGASYPSQPPVTGAYANQPMTNTVGYPSQAPMSAANYFNQPPAQAPAAATLSGPPPTSGFVPSSAPPRAGFLPRN